VKESYDVKLVSYKGTLWDGTTESRLCQAYALGPNNQIVAHAEATSFAEALDDLQTRLEEAT
jgi:hypothetical protein